VLHSVKALKQEKMTPIRLKVQRKLKYSSVKHMRLNILRYAWTWILLNRKRRGAGLRKVNDEYFGRKGLSVCLIRLTYFGE
jgi:hypothetical protein